MFRGSYEGRIDERGLVTVPVKFREQLPEINGHRCVIMTNSIIGNTRCLDLHSRAAWEALEKRVESSSQFDEKTLLFRTYYPGGAVQCTLDKRGRIHIPSSLRDDAGLRRDIVISAALSRFQVFDQEAYGNLVAQAEDTLMNDPK